jgi:hypothetical protein
VSTNESNTSKLLSKTIFFLEIKSISLRGPNYSHLKMAISDAYLGLEPNISIKFMYLDKDPGMIYVKLAERVNERIVVASNVAFEPSACSAVFLSGTAAAQGSFFSEADQVFTPSYHDFAIREEDFKKLKKPNKQDEKC